MKAMRMVPVLLFLGLGACDEGLLDIQPVDEISTDIAVVDEQSAEAALAGAYSGLQLGWYYGGDYLLISEIMTDNAESTGTFASYVDADQNALTADNGSLEGIWADIYDAINRVNVILQKLPPLDNVDAEAKDRILGEAYGLRALHYHNLVRGWSDVPLVLEPPADLDEAAQVTRAPAADVYAQILADLQAAETHLANAGATNDDRTIVTPGFIDALRARVYLYMEDWANAQAAAEAVVASNDYELVEDYSDLFTDEGDPTTEDIFRVVFTETDYNWLGYYYLFDGRFEQGATQEIYDAYPAGDERFDWTFEGIRSDGIEVAKFPTTLGGEDLHAIRYADLLLILAEAHAQQGGATNLASAVTYLNMVRERAELAPYDLVLDFGGSQQAVIDAIWEERRLELAFEGDRWFDLVRTGQATAVLPDLSAPEMLWPIPLRELDVAPNLTQNPGY